MAWRFRRPGADRSETRKFEESKDRPIDLLRLAFSSRHLSLIILLIFLTLIASQISDWQFDASLQSTYKHLPKELHPPIWRAIVMIFFVIFYGFFVVMAYGKVIKVI